MHGVDTFVHGYRRKHSDKHVPCTKTVYAMIDSSLLLVKNIDLPIKNWIRPRKIHRSVYERTRPRILSLTYNRPRKTLNYERLSKERKKYT